MNLGSRLRARYRYIMFFFARATLSVAFWELVVPRFGLTALTRRTRSGRYREIAISFRTMAIRMGGVMIKVGQFLSARLDVLPPEITEELAGLQDEVPPEEFGAIRALAEQELGCRLEEKFEVFETTPLAAASLGQVHRATLRAEAPEASIFRDVVVKIQRPFIEQLIAVDFRALRRFAGWLQLYGPIRRRVDIPALVNELATTVNAEIDYLAEGKHADTFRANFSHRHRVHVPRVAWSHTTQRVLTLENVYAIKITDYDAIRAAGIDPKQVATVLFDTYLRQIFEHQFFHADPHPGNLFVTPVPATPNRAATWRLTFVDFGMVGHVPERLRDGLREMLIAIGTRNSAKMVDAYKKLGMLLPSADLKLLEQAESQLFDRFWGMSMSELRRVHVTEMREFASQFRDLMYEMPFQVPHDLMLLGRTIAILSGMCTGLDRDFNVWTQLAPYAQKLVTEEVGTGWQVWLDELGEIAKQLVALPGQMSRMLDRLERGELGVDIPQIDQQIYYVEAAINRLMGGLIFAVFAFSGVLLVDRGYSTPGYVFWGLSATALLWTFLTWGHAPRRTRQ